MITVEEERPVSGESSGHQPLSACLVSLAIVCREGGVTLGRIREALGPDSTPLLLLVLLLPFCQPIPLPGLSTPFGLAVAWLGLRLLLGKPSSLPGRLVNVVVPSTFFPALLRVSGRLLAFLETSFPPRAPAVAEDRRTLRLVGLFVCLDGLLLSLPLPLPFSNTIPALSALFFITGILRKNILAQVVGCLAFAATLFYFWAVGWGAWELLGLIPGGEN